MAGSRYIPWSIEPSLSVYMRFVCMGGLERKTVSKLFALFIALLLPCLDMCGYPFNSGRKNPFTRYKMIEIQLHFL